MPSLRGAPPLLQGAGYTPGCEVNHRRNHPVNVHGCGIGWYTCERTGLVDELGLDAYDRPTVYTTVAAPSHDRNLRALSKTISSSLLFGHVRAAGPGASVHQYNCHPFYKGRYMMMHNGDVSGFSKIRRGLQARLRDDLFDHMSGTTDSELLFLLILNELEDCHTQQDPGTLQAAVLAAFSHVIRANGASPNSLNVAFTDGETVIATRYRNSAREEPPSLYFHLGPMPGEKTWDLNNAELGGFDAMETNPEVHDNAARRRDPRDPSGAHPEERCDGKKHDKFVATQALLVSSEPLTGGRGLDRWQLLPSNSMIVAGPVRPTVGRCKRAALVAKLREQSAGGGARHNLSNSSAPVLDVEVRCLESLCEDALAGETFESFKRKKVGLGGGAKGGAREKGGGETVDAVEDEGSSAFRDGGSKAPRELAGSLPSEGVHRLLRAPGDLPHRSNSGNGMEAIAASARASAASRRMSVDSRVRSGNPVIGFEPLPPTPPSPAKAAERAAKAEPFSFSATRSGLSGLRLEPAGKDEPAWKLAAEAEAEALISSPNAMSRPMEIRADAQAGSLKRTSSYDGCAA